MIFLTILVLAVLCYIAYLLGKLVVLATFGLAAVSMQVHAAQTTSVGTGDTQES